MNIMYAIFERLLKEKSLTTYRVSKETGISPSTFTHWKNGEYEPKLDKLQKIADYFGVTVDYLTTGEIKEDETPYYLNDEAREMAEELAKNPKLHILFDAARTVSVEDLQFVIDMVNRFKQDGE